MDCKYFGENKENVAYNKVFSDIVSEQLVVGNMLMKKLKVREKLREEVT